MRDNSYDRTVERNYIQKWRFLIREYEVVKAGQSTQFAQVGDFYRHHGTCSQSFRKYYNRCLRGGRDEDLLPRRRGPRWKSRRMAQEVEAVVLQQRALGLNRYEIYAILQSQSPQPPSPSAIHRAFRRHGINRLSKPMAEEKRRIIKQTIGELGHAICTACPTISSSRRRPATSMSSASSTPAPGSPGPHWSPARRPCR